MHAVRDVPGPSGAGLPYASGHQPPVHSLANGNSFGRSSITCCQYSGGTLESWPGEVMVAGLIPATEAISDCTEAGMAWRSRAETVDARARERSKTEEEEIMVIQARLGSVL